MKFNPLRITVLPAIILATSSFAAETDPMVVNGGNIHFTGEIVNAACAVSTASANQTVNLGQYRTASLAVAGDKTSPVPFNIQLVDCDPTVYGTAAVAFTGSALTFQGSSNLLALSSGGSNSPAASNVGVEITDYQSQILTMSGNDYSTASLLNEGNNTLSFNARYVATGVSTPGQANADATFVVKYE